MDEPPLYEHGPSNRMVTLAMAYQVEDMARKGIPLAEIARRVRLPYWRVKAICEAARVRFKP